MATITSPRASSPAVFTSLPSPSLASTADTPTSSHRPSIELTSAPTATVPQSQRRNRAALRDYYNLKSKPATSPGGPSASTSTPNLTRTSSVSSITSTSTSTTHPANNASSLPPTLDEPTFDAPSYIANLLRTSSLRDILRTESTLVSEIRNLDGERKALVYDNYSKLIKAVGTIGEMQRGMAKDRDPKMYGRAGEHEEGGALDGIRGLEGRLDGLISLFAEERRQVDGVEERKAKEGRERRRKVDKVRWVLEADERLRRLIQEGRGDDAESEWVEVKGLLEKWKDVEGVKEVREACERVMVIDEKGSDQDEHDNDDDDDDDNEENEKSSNGG